MIIEKLSDSRIIVMLSENDMGRFRTDHESCGTSDGHGRMLLNEILRKAEGKSGISFSGKKLTISAYGFGGIMILIIDIRRRRRTYRFIICPRVRFYCFDSSRRLFCFLGLMYLSGEAETPSSLFYDGRMWYFCFEDNKKSGSFLPLLKLFSSCAMPSGRFPEPDAVPVYIGSAIRDAGGLIFGDQRPAD